jgi:hypothetical protein
VVQVCARLLGATSPSWRPTSGRVARLSVRVNSGGDPISQPTNFALVINLKAATVVGLDPAISTRRDKVIE